MIVAACSGDSAATDRDGENSGIDQPYAGLQDREIRALSDERVGDLLAGNGAGYALAAELNSYPGPTHVLDLAERLGLSDDQQREVEAIFDEMQLEARELGLGLVELEADLDERFREGDIDEDEVFALTSEISSIEGKLRATHLAAHLKLRAILTHEQIAVYNKLRGYVAPADADDTEEPEHDSHDHHS